MQPGSRARPSSFWSVGTFHLLVGRPEVKKKKLESGHTTIQFWVVFWLWKGGREPGKKPTRHEEDLQRSVAWESNTHPSSWEVTALTSSLCQFMILSACGKLMMSQGCSKSGGENVKFRNKWSHTLVFSFWLKGITLLIHHQIPYSRMLASLLLLRKHISASSAWRRHDSLLWFCF